MADETAKGGDETPPENQGGKTTGEDKAKGRAAQATPQAAARQGKAAGTKTDAVELLKQDHRKVEALFDKFDKARNATEKKRLVAQIISEFLTHSLLEERIFYPACRERIDDDELDEAQVEHDGAKQLVEKLRGASPSDPYYDAKVTVLGEYIRHHVAEEERPKDGILAAAVAAGVDTETLGEEIEARREEFRQQAERYPPDMPSAGKTYKEQTMPQREYSRSSSRYADDDDDRRGSNARYQERDQYGRFTSDDDRGGSRGGGGSRGNDRDRDEEGRFTSSRGGDGRSGGYRASGGGGRYRDDDDDRRGGDHGGWFGDSRGHAEAARRGWDEREGRGRDDDDRRYASSSRSGGGARYRDDDDGRGRGHGGWFGDPEGHSEASRRGWDERESRGRYRDDDDDDRYSGHSSARYRDDDDDHRGSRGHGGWFGDSRGHSEAARRGWENR